MEATPGKVSSCIYYGFEPLQRATAMGTLSPSKGGLGTASEVWEREGHAPQVYCAIPEISASQG